MDRENERAVDCGERRRRRPYRSCLSVKVSQRTSLMSKVVMCEQIKEERAREEKETGRC